MFHGVHGEFRWLESGAHRIQDVLRTSPDVVNGKALVITTFASGPLLPGEDDLQRGWRLKGSVLYIPAGESQAHIPKDFFREWYIFPSTPPEREFAVFANYDWFTLGPAIASKPQANSRWDLRRIQRIFWQLMETAQPESYLAYGTRLLFVTRNPAYFTCVLKALGVPPKSKTAGL
jgi:hypothetical protein